MESDHSAGGVRQPNHRTSHRKNQQQQQLQQQRQQHGYNPEPQFQPPPSPVYDPNFQAASYYGYSVPGQMPPGGGGGNYYVGAPADQYPPGPQNFVNDPMANMALAYGQTLVGQGKHIVDQKLEKYVPISRLKYYFAVDTTYVRRKLILILFPFVNSDWAIKYQQDEPVAPRYETNAPDLYIPVMAFVTFILIAGLALGTQNKFSPEQLGIQASSAFGWLVIEIFVLLMTTYIGNIQTDLGYLDFTAYCSYKYIGMIASVCMGLAFHSMGYYVTLGYTSLSLCFFLVKTLRIQILPKSAPDSHPSHGNKRRMYLLLCIAVMQPLVMFWLTHRLIPTSRGASESLPI